MDKIYFSARTRYTRDMVKKGVAGMARISPYGTLFKLLRTLLVMLAVFVLIVGAGCFIVGKTGLGVLGVVQAVAYTALGVGFTRVVAWVVWVCIPKSRLENQFQFLDDYFTNEDPKKKKSCPYSKLKALLEDGERFYLCTGPGSFWMVDKAGFTAGESGEFKAFLKKKCPALNCETI